MLEKNSMIMNLLYLIHNWSIQLFFIQTDSLLILIPCRLDYFLYFYCFVADLIMNALKVLTLASCLHGHCPETVNTQDA